MAKETFNRDGNRNDRVWFVPSELIDEYWIVRHSHPGHQVYEIGHELQVLDKKADFIDAYKSFLEVAVKEPLERKEYVDFNLVGTYKGQRVQFSMEGTPEGETGLHVASAYASGTTLKDRHWDFEQYHNPSDPIMLDLPAGYYSAELKFAGPAAKIDQEIYDAMNNAFVNGNAWMAFNTVSFHKNISDFDFFSCEREAEHHIFSMGRDLDEYRVVELKSVDAAVRGIIYGVDEYRWYNTINPDFLRRENGIEMNEKVYEYHKKQLRSRGVGDALDDALKIMLEKGEKQSSLYHTTKFGEDLSVTTFKYNKSNRPDSDLVFLNEMELLVKPKVGEIQKQSFDITGNSDVITIKNAYNAMQKRSFLINKDEKEWAFLDFKQIDKDGNHPLVRVKGVDAEAVLRRYPGIKEMSTPEESQRLVSSLERGNRQMVHVGENRFFVEALPLHDTLRVYKENLQQTTVEALKPAAQQKQSDSQATGQNVTKEGNAQKNDQHRGQSIS
ncbi:hypothetical protein SAMN04488128_1011191 [Chitinophaga eiseniae]|uniref:Uncharacterized protein n=1 Tax=Chitinophaga eiseniae TaxID=634771 RepID=A0A1T4MP19_9BACT|nr:hypothetical protein [Chitinophaga eiseniae]SJZ68468.1 hypothetical protein SAMN04488128_1011191 [Chitinophaga eiseniae]